MFKSTKRRGFTLLEAIFALFVTILCVITLQYQFHTFNHFSSENKNNVVLDWHLANCAVQDQLNHAQTTDQSLKTRNVIGFEQIGGKHYRIEYYEQMLRITGIMQGHMPLILNVKGAEFNYFENRLRIQLVLARNRKFTSYYDLPMKVEKEENRHEKDQSKRDVDSNLSVESERYHDNGIPAELSTTDADLSRRHSTSSIGND